MNHPASDEIRKEQKKQIMNKTQELLDLILNSEDYILYKKEREELKQSENLYAKMNEFRRKSLEMQLSGQEGVNFENLQELYNEYSETLMEPQVSKFMNKEQSICKLLRKVQDRISHGVDLDTSYME
ncbi:MAG: YlbF family regulator [Eubacteriales bacterium]|nr:YlbF family regulator [Eubacteriales bacterium]